jgi:hypothetical protein
MSREHADELQDIIESGDQWPLAHEAPVLRQIREWNALAESH